MIRRRNRKATRPAAWLAMFAILLQALLPAVHHPAGMALAGVGNDKIAGLDIAQYLCVAPSSTTPDKPGKVPAHHIPPCALCSAVHAIGGFAPPVAPVIAVSREFGIVAPTTTALVPLQQRPTPRQQPRAPPVLV